MKKKRKKIIDLFCGAGGFSFGFEMEDFETVLAIDKWKDAITTYNYNHINQCGLDIDIKDYKDEDIKNLLSKYEIDGVIGGPPCQGFSMVGTRNPFDDRNRLYLEFVRFVRIVRPKFFILENVKGLLNLEGGYFTKDIVERFDKLGYNVNYKVLRASEYGVPQIRERVFFVGLCRSKVGINSYFNFPNPNYDNIITTKSALGDLPLLDRKEKGDEYRSEPLNEFQKIMRENMDSCKIKNNDITLHTEKTKKIISMVPDGGNIKDLPEEYYSVRNYNSAFKRMNSNSPSSTIDCGHRNFFHYSENRVPTVRESARIQSFPDRFTFIGSKTSQYTQVGNAVPPLLAREIAIKISKILDEK